LNSPARSFRRKRWTSRSPTTPCARSLATPSASTVHWRTSVRGDCTRSSSASSKTSRSPARRTPDAPSRSAPKTCGRRWPIWSATKTSRVTSSRSALRRAVLAVLLVPLAASCGKKGDPMPPLPRAPNAISDLAVEQEGADATLTFSYPDRLMNGEPLRDVASIEVYRAADPSPAIAAPRRTPVAGAAAPGDLAPGSAARREAANVRLAEDAFYGEAKLVGSLPVAEIAERTRGATIVYRDALYPLLSSGKPPTSLACAVVTVGRRGERSPLSNIAILTPDVPPGPPVLTTLTAEEGRICLEWTPSESAPL